MRELECNSVIDDDIDQWCRRRFVPAFELQEDVFNIHRDIN